MLLAVLGTERGRFELPEPFGSSDFKSDAIDHSATSPGLSILSILVALVATVSKPVAPRQVQDAGRAISQTLQCSLYPPKPGRFGKRLLLPKKPGKSYGVDRSGFG